MDDIPTSIPLSDTPSLTDSELRRLLPPDTDIAEAKSACATGSLYTAKGAVERLTSEGVPVVNLRGCLLEGIRSRDEAVVEMLLSKGVPIKHVRRGASGTTEVYRDLVFATAIWMGHQQGDGVVFSVSARMDITPLSNAVLKAPLPVIELLFAHSNPPYRGELLHNAAMRTTGDAEEVVRMVLERCQLDINHIVYEGDVFSYEVWKVSGLGTALHEAAKIGNASVVQLLLASGADVSIRDSCGRTALEVAELFGHHSIVEMLRGSEC
ncbi:uncharacterized protein LTR77_002395 [Saxophila tyrrhenica]|uniref:Uncharacterized protein n=1 Tax=Saxophila tyrrhenica TaxID=1690608 RepID=A0AAV9PIH4_9PEZI|nr:hypothetical protein LTR77_002395 [Saxophila tyrrhenica]